MKKASSGYCQTQNRFCTDGKWSNIGCSWDCSGVIILAATAKMLTEDPVVAKVSAMLWALQLAKCYHFQHCIIEGNAIMQRTA